VEKKRWLKTADADFDVGFYLYRGGPTVFFCLLPGKRLRGSGMTVWSGFCELELVMGRQRHDFFHKHFASCKINIFFIFKIN
jgi:hypothetical protein